MKKLISVFLCALMVLSLFTTALALPSDDDSETLNGIGTTQPDADSIQVSRYCDGGCREENLASPVYKDPYRVNGGSQCYLVTPYTRVCRACGRLNPGEKLSDYQYHDFSVEITSSCNGYTQTLVYGCAYHCSAHNNVEQDCFFPGHPGSCRWLPF